MSVSQQVLDSLSSLTGPPLYGITALLAFGESAALADLVLPGETGMIVAGAVAGRGGGSLPLMVAVAAAGAIAGDVFSYWMGRKFGLTLVRKWEPVRKRMEPRVERAQEFFERRGGPAVFAGRWIGALRAVVPAIAGMSGMSFPKFLAWVVPAAVLWTAAAVSLGYVAGTHFTAVIDKVMLGLSVVVVVGAIAWAVVRKIRKRRGGAGEAPAREEQAA
jgi:membrane protein DedA with SNARE-associated domain